MQLRPAVRTTRSAATVLLRPHVAIAYAAVLAVALAPLWFATYPPLHDYPFHLARIDILARWHASSALQRWYDLRSFLLPNVGMDVVTLLLTRFLPIVLAGRVFVALTLALMLGGTVALHRVLFGRFTLWPSVSALFLFNWILLYGFLNYLFGIAVLLWATAAWVAITERPAATRVLAGTCLSASLFFCHFVALVLFAVVVAGYELQRCMKMFQVDGAGRSLREILTGASIFVVPFILFLLCPTAGEVGSTVRYDHPFLPSKLFFAWRTCMAGDWTLDIALSAAVVIAIIVVAVAGAWRAAGSMTLALALLTAAFFALPESLFSAQHVDERLPIAIVFLAIGSVAPVLKSRRLRTAATAAVVLLIVFRAARLAAMWNAYDGVIERFTRGFAGLPEGSTLFVASEAPMPTMKDMDLTLWQPPLKHVASLAGLGRSIFVPATWAHPSQQPLSVTERYRPMYDFQTQNPVPVDNEKLLGFLVGRLRSLARTTGERDAPVYLLLLYPQRLRLGVPEHTHVAASGPSFALLSIDPPTVK